MSHFAIIVPPLYSHIRSMEALALHLSGKGHRLTFIASPELIARDNPRISGCPSLPEAIAAAQRRFRDPAARTFFRIAARRPLLVMPVAFDQPAVAARVTYHNLGRRVSRLATASTLAREITALLDDSHGVGKNLAQASQALRDAGGAARAAAIAERALLSGRPVYRGTAQP